MIARRYRLEEVAGAGGMGVVWRATDLELRREVAIKQSAEGDTRREARIGAGLQHPNVIAVFDVLVTDGERLLVMEYLPSRTLARVLRDDGPLTPDAAARIGAQIAGALAAMHAKGMVHRDITPGNVLVAADGTAKLSDLGIALWAGITDTGSSLSPGTPGFAAPEVVAGGAPTAASDMYAFGVTLATAVEGAEGEEQRSSWFGLVLSALTHPHPKRRPSASQVGEMLRDVVADVPKRRRPRRLLLAAGALLLVLLTVAGVLVWQRVTAAPPANPAALGDLRTIDVCGFLDKAPLARFGAVEVAHDVGPFNVCSLTVAADPRRADGRARVTVSIQHDPYERPDAGKIEQLALGGSRDHCAKQLLLPGPYEVMIWSEKDEGVQADVCAMADALADHVRSVLEQGNTPRRAVPELPSIGAVDACSLLRPEELGEALGAPADSIPGVAGWSCQWRRSPDLQVGITLERGAPIGAADGQQMELAGRIAMTSCGPAAVRGCPVQVVHRFYTNAGGEPRTELVTLFLGGDGSLPAEVLRERAVRLAALAAARLPPA